MAAIVADGKLWLTGYVGDYYFEDGFTSSDVIIALTEIDDDADLPVHLNSGGGIATEGAAIHALLSARSGRTHIIVEGIAASAASLIAMAGDTVTMSAGSIMMIHDPSTFTEGTSADLSKTIDMLEALGLAYARVYATKSGKTVEEAREIMKAERWYAPEEAVAEGFADDTSDAKAGAVAAFDYRIYARAPNRFTALAKQKKWSIPATSAVKAAATHSQQEKKSMTEEEIAALVAENARLKAEQDTAGSSAVKAALDRRAAIMALKEAKGREALAEHLFNTGSTIDQAKATLAVSPKAADEDEDDGKEFQPRRANGAGMNSNGGQKIAKGDRMTFLTAAVERTNKRR